MFPFSVFCLFYIACYTALQEQDFHHFSGHTNKIFQLEIVMSIKLLVYIFSHQHSLRLYVLRATGFLVSHSFTSFLNEISENSLTGTTVCLTTSSSPIHIVSIEPHQDGQVPRRKINLAGRITMVSTCVFFVNILKLGCSFLATSCCFQIGIKCLSGQRKLS